jgi:hypothetical protein
VTIPKYASDRQPNATLFLLQYLDVTAPDGEPTKNLIGETRAYVLAHGEVDAPRQN